MCMYVCMYVLTLTWCSYLSNMDRNIEMGADIELEESIISDSTETITEKDKQSSHPDSKYVYVYVYIYTNN